MGTTSVELVSAGRLNEATASIHRGGDGVREGVAILLEAKVEYHESNGTGGKNCAQALAAAMRRLTEDPYMTLGVNPTSTEADIKKSYRKLALKYHPDKNKATPALFQIVQGAHDVLMDPGKRAAHDARRKRQNEALEKLRKQNGGKNAAQQPAGEQGAHSQTPPKVGREQTWQVPRPQGASPASGVRSPQGGPSSTSSSGPATGGGGKAYTSGKEKVHQFNKRVYEEFQREAKRASQRGAKEGGGTADGGSGRGGTHQPPPKPKMRTTNRTDATVTLEWHCGTLPSSTAYELQWRQRGRAASEWVTSPTLVVGNTCRKKNLEPCTCYEFRVRAASAWGWSGHCDPVMVVTLPSGGGGGGSSSSGGRAGGGGGGG
ncbi:unnamed protein product [Discosporangium mesarthrocarpum]